MQKQRNEPRADALAGKAATGNPEASAAAKKAKDALTKLDEQPSNPLQSFPFTRWIGSTRVIQDGEAVWERDVLRHGGMDINSMLFISRRCAHQKGGLVCICGDPGCNIGPFIWRN